MLAARRQEYSTARQEQAVVSRQVSPSVAGSHADLSLRDGLNFQDLYRQEGLVRLDAIFLDQLRQRAADLHAALLAARQDPSALTPKAHSELLIAVAPHLEDFL